MILHLSRRFLSMGKVLSLFIILPLVLSPFFGRADDIPPKREILTTTTSAWDGSGVFYRLTKNDQITAVKLTFPPKAATPWHYHEGRTLGYVLQGTLEVTTKNGQSKIFRKGDVLVEVVNTVHRGVNIGKDDLIIVVFYSVDKDKPTAITVEP